MKIVYSRQQLKNLPQVCGVYLFLNKADQVIYVGKAINLKRRVCSYFKSDHERLWQPIQRFTDHIKVIKIITVDTEFEALLLETKLIKLYQPKYNVILKDGKNYIYVKITKEEYPRVLLSRKQDLTETYFGPFPSKKVVQDLLSQIRNIIPFCTQKLTKKPCFHTFLGLCDPCPSVIVKLPSAERHKKKLLYQRQIRQLTAIFAGKIDILTASLDLEMKTLAKQRKYEQAALVRDKIKKFSDLLAKHRSPDIYLENPNFNQNIQQQESRELLKLLSSYYPKLKKVDTIECYDVSNLGTDALVGAMVTFKRGLADKKFYRKFKIKTVKQVNDFASLAEIINRRLKHKEWPYPDLFLIDGGHPQLYYLRRYLANNKFNIPYIGLAKKNETLIIPYQQDFISLNLAKDTLSLRLIQRIRDEAHRFAHDYFLKQRLKSVFSN